MDQPEPFTRTLRPQTPASIASIPVLDRSDSDPGLTSEAGEARLSLVSGRLVLSSPEATIPADWDKAITHLALALKIDTHRIHADRPASLMDRARRAMGASGDPRAPLFAPWRCAAPTGLIRGAGAEFAPGFRWVASYLFDTGAGPGMGRRTVDLVLMSPAPEMCDEDDPSVGPIARGAVLNAMLNAAASQGRKRVSIIARDAARNALAARLLTGEAATARSQMDIEVLSIEEAVVRIQRGALDWDAIICAPDLRGILFATLAEASSVAGPWPALWHDRELVAVTGETLNAGAVPAPLDASLLMQALALLARHTGCGYTAERLIENWAAIRDRGVTTASRGSSAPYVNQIADAQFITEVTGEPVRTRRALPAWKGIAFDRPDRPATGGTAHLSLVASR